MKKRNKLLKVIFSAALIFAIAATGLVQFLPKATSRDSDVPNQNVALDKTDDSGQTQENGKSKEEPAAPEEESTARTESDYLTYSSGGNIDIGVVFMNPLTGDNDTLSFKVMIDTHSVDLSQYERLTDFAELQTDDRTIIGEEFEWVENTTDSHHVSGILEVNNNYNGTPILSDNIKFLKLIFKDIGTGGVREHLYQDEALR